MKGKPDEKGQQPNLIKKLIANTSCVCNHVAHRGGGDGKKNTYWKEHEDAPSYDLTVQGPHQKRRRRAPSYDAGIQGHPSRKKTERADKEKGRMKNRCSQLGRRRPGTHRGEWGAWVLHPGTPQRGQSKLFLHSSGPFWAGTPLMACNVRPVRFTET